MNQRPRIIHGLCFGQADGYRWIAEIPSIDNPWIAHRSSIEIHMGAASMQSQMYIYRICFCNDDSLFPRKSATSPPRAQGVFDPAVCFRYSDVWLSCQGPTRFQEGFPRICSIPPDSFVSKKDCTISKGVPRNSKNKNNLMELRIKTHSRSRPITKNDLEKVKRLILTAIAHFQLIWEKPKIPQIEPNCEANMEPSDTRNHKQSKDENPKKQRNRAQSSPRTSTRL